MMPLFKHDVRTLYREACVLAAIYYDLQDITDDCMINASAWLSRAGDRGMKYRHCLAKHSMICGVMAAGWLLFMVFCGAGLVALPLDMIREFLGRPKSTITKSEYMTRAKGLGNKAKRIVVSTACLIDYDWMWGPVLPCFALGREAK